MAPKPAGQRSRSNSVKRKEPEGPSFAEITAGPNSLPVHDSENVDDATVIELTTEITKVTSACDKLADNVNALEADPAIILVFTGIITALRGITDVQCKIVNTIQHRNPPQPPPLPNWRYLSKSGCNFQALAPEYKQ
jgi:hypothetical protein